MTIDWWTLGFQTVNIVILIWLLQRFFWKPISAMIAERRAAAQIALSEADAAREKAKLALVDIEKTRARFAQEREAILGQARADAEQGRTAGLAEAARQDAAAASAAKIGAERDKAAAKEAWAARSAELAVDIAKRLAARLEGVAVRRVFLDWALKAVRALPATARGATTGSPYALEATSATPLDIAEQAQATQSLGDAFGFPVRVVFKTDPDLIAGLELKGDHLVVANSWRADLAQTLAALSHDK